MSAVAPIKQVAVATVLETACAVLHSTGDENSTRIRTDSASCTDLHASSCTLTSSRPAGIPNGIDFSGTLPTTSEYLSGVLIAANSTTSPATTTVRHAKSSTSIDNWTEGVLTSARLDKFATVVLPSTVQAQLQQTFGKDSIRHSFYAEKCFRHILLPLLKSTFLSCRATKTLEKASRRVRQLQQLRKRYRKVDFLPLQGFQADWEKTTTIRDDWKAMTTACLLHFNGDVATMVRWIGGPHVNAHVDVTKTLRTLQPIVTHDVYTDLRRILTTGAPALCNADATEENFQAFRLYGNHKSVKDNQSVFAQTIVKQSKRGLTLIMDPTMIHFALNAHLSPQGLVDVIHPRRKPRPLSDSSFRPYPGASAINDWTDKTNEPVLHFASSFLRFCVWQWNLAITYPTADRHTGDDDVQCAFPRVKYNPHLVAMHSAISNGTLVMSTGLTFGDNTSPSNWEPIARARQQLAQHLWHDDDIIIRAAPYLPTFTFATPATPSEREAFTRAIPDSINTGVMDANGKRRAPTYDHHVDDNMYADTTEFLQRAAAASVIALYEIVGYPDGRIPDPISWEKFDSTHGHIRRIVGWEFNTRDLTFSLPSDKRQIIINLLASWTTRSHCTLLEAAELHGTLTDASRANRKGRATFFSFQNALRRAIRQRFYQVQGYYNRTRKEGEFKAQLPKDLQHRLDRLIARDMATLIWRTKTHIPLLPPVLHELKELHRQFADLSRPWSINIGHIIPRDEQFTSLGDACGTGGGAYCHDLEYWFDIIWSPRTRHQFETGQTHINILEFIVVLLQLAAAITRAEENGGQFGIQPLSKLLIRTDNSPSRNWAHKVSAKSEQGQLFVSMYADLLERTTLTVDCNHIAGESNTLADFISRPQSLTDSRTARCNQIFQRAPKLRSYPFFRPSHELLSCLESRLSAKQWQESPPLPKLLGQFVTGDSIISSFVII